MTTMIMMIMMTTTMIMMTIAGKAGLLSKVGAASALGQSNAPDHPPPCTHQLRTSNSQRPKIQSIYEAIFLNNVIEFNLYFSKLPWSWSNFSFKTSTNLQPSTSKSWPTFSFKVSVILSLNISTISRFKILTKFQPQNVNQTLAIIGAYQHCRTKTIS